MYDELFRLFDWIALWIYISIGAAFAIYLITRQAKGKDDE